MIETIFYISSITLIIVLIICCIESLMYSIHRHFKVDVITVGDTVKTIKNDLGVKRGTTGIVEDIKHRYMLIRDTYGNLWAVSKRNIKKVEDK